MGEITFVVLALATVGLTVYDFVFGGQIRYRRALHAVIVVLFLATGLTVPSCGNGVENGREVDDIPYSF